jgi:bifunctional DNA-binding transcriptional regulator/antitoxin component of YhaV-PrlF toxin-antitoxin module
MTIPEEVSNAIGLVPGDRVKILWGDQGTIIIQKAKETDAEE